MTPRLSMAVVTKTPGNSARMLQALQHQAVEGHHVSSLEELQALMNGAQPIDGAFVEVAGFGRDIWDLCEALRQHDTPFFLISGEVSKVENLGARHGARATLAKPLPMTLLEELIEDLTERKRGRSATGAE